MKKAQGKKKLDTPGKRIRDIRGDMTQQEFASILEIKQAMVSRYEADKEVPSPKNLLKMAAFTGKSMEWLLTGKDSLFDTSEKPGGHLSREDFLKYVAENLLNTHDSDAPEFNKMMMVLFKDKKRMRKVLDYFNYIMAHEK